MFSFAQSHKNCDQFEDNFLFAAPYQIQRIICRILKYS